MNRDDGQGRRIRPRAMTMRNLALAAVLCPAALGVAASVAAEERQGTPPPPDVGTKAETAAAVPSGPSAPDRSAFAAIVAREAQLQGLPPAVADAVAFVESGYDAHAVGTVGELGLMQVRPATAAMLGHRGPATDLFDPSTNARFGVAYLTRAWKLARGDLCRTLMKYRAGHGEERMSPLSIDYCRRARDRLAFTGSALAAAAFPVVSMGVADGRSGARLAAKQRGLSAALVPITARFWAEHVSRIRAIEARSNRVMSGG